MNNSTNTNAARYEVQIEHTDAPSWLVAPRVVVGARDEPHARLTVETTADDAQALEAALIEDDLVDSYSVTQVTRYEVVMAYSDDVIRWDAPFTMVSVLSQGAHGDRLLISTTDPVALEAAMEADDLVLSYDVAADETTDETPGGS